MKESSVILSFRVPQSTEDLLTSLYINRLKHKTTTPKSRIKNRPLIRVTRTQIIIDALMYLYDKEINQLPKWLDYDKQKYKRTPGL